MSMSDTTRPLIAEWPVQAGLGDRLLHPLTLIRNKHNPRDSSSLSWPEGTLGRLETLNCLRLRTCVLQYEGAASLE